MAVLAAQTAASARLTARLAAASTATRLAGLATALARLLDTLQTAVAAGLPGPGEVEAGLQAVAVWQAELQTVSDGCLGLVRGAGEDVTITCYEVSLAVYFCVTLYYPQVLHQCTELAAMLDTRQELLQDTLHFYREADTCITQLRQLLAGAGQAGEQETPLVARLVDQVVGSGRAILERGGSAPASGVSATVETTARVGTVVREVGGVEAWLTGQEERCRLLLRDFTGEPSQLQVLETELTRLEAGASTRLEAVPGLRVEAGPGPRLDQLESGLQAARMRAVAERALARQLAHFLQLCSQLSREMEELEQQLAGEQKQLNMEKLEATRATIQQVLIEHFIKWTS